MFGRRFRDYFPPYPLRAFFGYSFQEIIYFMRFLAVFLPFFLLLHPSLGLAQWRVEVRRHVRFGDMDLQLTAKARADIQRQVNRLLRNKQSLLIKAKRAQAHFPVIEEIFNKEGVPEVCKYLAIQESALVGDVVSSSQAVGYWQFKRPTAQEVGLRVDRWVDERMHLMRATEGAARYLKRHYFQFGNWVYALTAYYAGAGGAKKYVEQKYIGKRKMVIGKQTHWYVKTFLAHWFAFEHVMEDMEAPTRVLKPYEADRGDDIDDIVDVCDCEKEVLLRHNKWLRGRRAPRHYASIFLVLGEPEKKGRSFFARRKKKKKASKARTLVRKWLEAYGNYVFRMNGLPTLVAHSNDTWESLAKKGKVSVRALKRYNEQKKGDEVISGQLYYLSLKRKKSNIHYHVVQEGESWWSIAQHYGMRTKSLLKKNRIKKNTHNNTWPMPQTGWVVWLSSRRPKNTVFHRVTLPTEAAATPVVLHSDSLSHPSLQELHMADMREIPADSIWTPLPILTATYKVIPGDTPYGIAKRYGLALEDMLRWNNLRGGEAIRPGETLRLRPPKKLVAISPQKAAVKTKNTHQVKEGESLYSIAKKYRLSLQQLMKYNDLSQKDVIHPKDILRIAPLSPQKEKSPRTPPPIHIVQEGESLYSIARKHGLSLQTLRKHNALQNSTIHPKDTLRLPTP